MPRPHTAPHRFDRTDWLHVGGMAGFIALLTALGWFVMIAIVDPGNYRLGTAGAFGTGLGLTAYLLGMRHAFDADHIAAIDNTTRKLAADGQRARGVGFWFSLGHSSVVFVLCLFLALGVRTVTGALDDDGSAARQVHGVAGTIISGAFLVALGLLNLVALIGISRVFARMRSENLDEAQLEHHLNSPWLPHPRPRPGAARGQQAVAHVPGRLRVRARLRHRQRGHPARARRRRGGVRAALVRDPGAAGARVLSKPQQDLFAKLAIPAPRSRRPGILAGQDVPDPGGLFHPVQGHVHQHRADHSALRAAPVHQLLPFDET
jgi:hypothetical protein